MYATNVPAPSMRMVGRALSAVSHPSGVLMTASLGKRISYWHIDADKLLQWAEDNGYCTAGEILDGLAADTSIQGMAPPDEQPVRNDMDELERDGAVPF